MRGEEDSGILKVKGVFFLWIKVVDLRNVRGLGCCMCYYETVFFLK